MDQGPAVHGFMRHFESLGSNCELGFALQKAGIKAPSMFKWVLIEHHEHLLAALEGGLEGIYEAENLTPRYDTMVRDAKYGLCFHTSLPILNDGEDNRTFGGTAEERGTIHEREQSKFRYFASTFLERLRAPEKIYVYRSNQDLRDEDIDRLLRLLRKPGGGASLLVMKQSDSAHPAGTITVVKDGLYVGYLRYLSTSKGLEDIDYEAWFETCRNAWRVHVALNGLAEDDASIETSESAPTRLPDGFDPTVYLLTHPDVARAGVDAGDHYLRHGWKEGRELG